jgi:ribosome-binding protein aMBF1 (putative translation factor)
LEGKTEKVKCQICGAEVSSKEIYLWSGLKVCEDCYFEKAYPVRTCDPVAVHAAKTLKATGVKLEERLTDVQKAIFNYVLLRGKATIEELCNELKISRREIEIQIAILRHLELVKGRKEGNQIYIVPFQA